MNILVVAGATREPIDAVRFLSNGSTGATGAALADAWAARGHRVDLLAGVGAMDAQRARERETFTTAADLGERLGRRLKTGRYAVVAMVAGVSDYRPAAASAGKIGSEPRTILLRLVRNPKLLPHLKTLSPRPLFVIGFKLTVNATAAARNSAVAAQFSAGRVDAVVHNDLAEIRRSTLHPFRLFHSPELSPVRTLGVQNLADALEGLFAAGGR